MNYGRIGIDAGSRWIKGVETGRRGETLRAAAFPRLSERFDDAEITRISAILKRKGFSAGEVTLVCPRESLRRQIVTLPSKPDDERDAGIVAGTFEASGDVSSGPEPVWWDLAPGAKSDKREVLAYAIDSGDAHSWFESFARAGLNLSSIDIHPAAAVRLADEDMSIVADLAYSHLGLTLSQGRRPVYERHDAGLGMRRLLALEGRRLGQSSEHTESLMLKRGALDRGEIAGFQAWVQRVSDAALALSQYAQRKYPGSADPTVLLVGGGVSPLVVETLGRLTGLACRCACAPADSITGIACVAAKRGAA